MTLDREAMRSVAQTAGFDHLPDDVLDRIAAGAARAAAAVRASLEGSLFEAEPAQFQTTLEELAPDEDER
jgi:hypothetical protein